MPLPSVQLRFVVCWNVTAGLFDGVEAAVLRGLQVFAEVHLQRRLAVSEQIVGRAHARRDVVEAGDAILPREDEVAAEPVVGGDAVLALGEPAPRVLVAQRRPAA